MFHPDPATFVTEARAFADELTARLPGAPAMPSTSHLAPGARVRIAAMADGMPAQTGYYIGPNVLRDGTVSETSSICRIPHKGRNTSSLSIVKNHRIS